MDGLWARSGSVAGKMVWIYHFLPDPYLGADIGGRGNILCLARRKYETGDRRVGLDRFVGGGHDNSTRNGGLADSLSVAHTCRAGAAGANAVAVIGVRWNQTLVQTRR